MKSPQEMFTMQRIDFQKQAVRAHIWISCISCEFFAVEEFCRKFDARPPADVIVVGCESHVCDIPF